MKIGLIIYSALSVLLTLLSYLYFDITLADYFKLRLGNDVWQFFRFITESGEGIYWIIPPGIVYFAYKYVPLTWLPYSFWFEKYQQQAMRISGFVALSALSSGLIVNIFKLIFARFRPIEYFDLQNYGMTWFDHGYRIASFPSGHSATAMGVAMALVLLFPRYRYLFFVCGIAVTFSRVVITAHFFSDVVIGGYVGVMTSVYLFDRYFRQRPGH